MGGLLSGSVGSYSRTRRSQELLGRHDAVDVAALKPHVVARAAEDRDVAVAPASGARDADEDLRRDRLHVERARVARAVHRLDAATRRRTLHRDARAVLLRVLATRSEQRRCDQESAAAMRSSASSPGAAPSRTT